MQIERTRKLDTISECEVIFFASRLEAFPNDVPDKHHKEASVVSTRFQVYWCRERAVITTIIIIIVIVIIIVWS